MSKRIKTILILVGALLLVLAAAAVFVATWKGSTGGIVAAADSLHIPADWQKVSEKVEPPRMMCLGGVSCPSLSRSYEIKSELSSRVTINDIVKGSIFTANIDNGCDREPPISNMSETYIDCRAEITGSKYSGDIYIEKSSQYDAKASRLVMLLGESR